MNLTVVVFCWLLIVGVAWSFPAPCPHHPHSRPGHCDEARQHFGVRHAREPFGTGRRGFRVVCQGRHVASAENGTIGRFVGL